MQLSHQEELLQRSIAIQESERKRIAAQVHDILGNKLTVLSMWLRNKSSFPEEEYESKIEDQISTAIDVTRKISHDLYPARIQYDGLMYCIKDLFSLLSPEYNTTVLPLNPYKELPFKKEIQVYRIIQEFINNSIKHAKATDLELLIHSGRKNVTFLLKDNGIGFDQKDVKKGLGHKNVATRVAIIEGQHKWKSKQNAGTRLIITVNYEG